MGLWLKCPQCQTANPLDLASCAKCNAPLDNLPADQRVYILAQAAPAAPPAAAEAAPPEGIAAASSPPKRAKGAKTRKKKS
jgi:hypothetical protein